MISSETIANVVLPTMVAVTMIVGLVVATVVVVRRTRKSAGGEGAKVLLVGIDRATGWTDFRTVKADAGVYTWTYGSKTGDVILSEDMAVPAGGKPFDPSTASSARRFAKVFYVDLAHFITFRPTLGDWKGIPGWRTYQMRKDTRLSQVHASTSNDIMKMVKVCAVMIGLTLIALVIGLIVISGKVVVG